MNKTAPKAATAAARALVGKVLGGKYRLDALLGRGGMGVVYRGSDLSLRRQVAVKVLHAQFSRNEIITRRFEREAQSVARLSHPNIVRVYEHGSTPGGLRYLVMELLEGQELKALLGQPMSPHLALARAQQILSGLAHAHAHGIIHRDLKPENVFVTRDHNGHERVKLVDFGVAKLVDPSLEPGEDAEPGKPGGREDTRALTQAGLIFGTPTYMSPEQATGTPVDARSDLYSFGIILYEMLAGRPPLSHKDPICLIRMQVGVSAPPLSETFNEDLRLFVHNLLQKSREDRFQRSEQALKELSELLDETPVNLPPGPALSEEEQSAWVRNTQAGRDALSNRNTYPGADSRSWYLNLGKRPRTKLRRTILKTRRWASRNPLRAAAACAGVLGVSVGLIVGVDGLFRGNGDKTKLFVSSQDIKRPSPAKTELAEIDRAILAKDLKGASKRLDPLLDLYPKNGQLLWRLAKTKQLAEKIPHRQLLTLYSSAMRTDATLLDDPEFYRDVYEILTHEKTRRADAINVAVDYMNNYGHPFLLSVINAPDAKRRNSPLKYELRHRIIDKLRENEESARLIDDNLHLHQDLIQASKQPDPCGVFLTALESIEKASKSAYFLNPLHEASVPRANPKLKDPQQAARCEAANAKLKGLREKLEQTYGAGTLREKPIVSAQELAKKQGSTAAPKRSPADKASSTAGRAPARRSKGKRSRSSTRKRRSRANRTK